MPKQIAALVAVLATLLLGTLILAPRASADEPLFPGGSTGYDVSFPQCSLPLPSQPYAFAIVGVTGGRPFTTNPCLATQYQWALKSGRPPGLYVNTKSPVGMNAEEALTGPAGNCLPTDEACKADNFGYKLALHAVAHAKAQNVTAGSWWLDIETMNTWSADTAMNARVIASAIRFLQNEGKLVGIYSSPQQWTEIAGSYQPGLPVWVAMAPNAAAAPGYCTREFAGGEVHLVQYIVNNFDVNYACRLVDRVPQPIGPAGSTVLVMPDGGCLNMRATPGLSGRISACLATGTRLMLLPDALVNADGFHWHRVTTGTTSGWVVSVYIQPVTSTTPTPTPAPTPTPIATPLPTPTPVPTPSGTFAAPPRFGAAGQSLVVFVGGTVDQLEAATSAAGASGAWIQESSGAYHLLIPGGPAFLKVPIVARFPSGFAAATAVMLTKQG